MRNKYHSKKVEVDGITFDSKKEAKRFAELSLFEKAGVISDLQRQVKFVLIPAQREPDTVGARGGTKKGKAPLHRPQGRYPCELTGSVQLSVCLSFSH